MHIICQCQVKQKQIKIKNIRIKDNYSQDINKKLKCHALLHYIYFRNNIYFLVLIVYIYLKKKPKIKLLFFIDYNKYII